jgi:UDP-N-acetylmuramoylalanine--D-glutamate ligase
LVAEINGVCWYNDSKATTPESAIAALEAFEKPTIIIAGGYDKHVAFDGFSKTIAEKAKVAVLIGQTAEKIAGAIRKTQNTRLKAQDAIRNTRIEIVNSLAEAVQLANKVVESGDIVLLSPACASYDMFDNFQQRGQEFCRLVQKISS